MRRGPWKVGGDAPDTAGRAVSNDISENRWAIDSAGMSAAEEQRLIAQRNRRNASLKAFWESQKREITENERKRKSQG